MLANMQVNNIDAIKARRARLGYVVTNPLVPRDLVRPKPAKSVPPVPPAPPVPIAIMAVPDFTIAVPAPCVAKPKSRLKFKPRLIKLNHPRIDDIIIAVAYEFVVTPEQILSVSRVNEIVVPRHVVSYIAREMTPYSFPAIGRMMGGRDHTTILNSWKKIHARISKDKDMQKRVERIKKILRKGLGLK